MEPEEDLGKVTLFTVLLFAITAVAFTLGCYPVAGAFAFGGGTYNAYRWHRKTLFSSGKRLMTETQKEVEVIQKGFHSLQEKAKELPIVAPLVPTPTPAPALDNVLDAIWQAMFGLPHILLIGETGGGKSVILRALIAWLHANGAEVWVLDTNTAKRHVPPGVNLIYDENQWEPTLQKLIGLFGQRLEAWRNAATDNISFTPIWIVFDEAQNAMAKDECKALIDQLVRQGRKVEIHIILASTDSQVKNLRLEGSSALLNNLTKCVVKKEENGQRTVTINKKPYPIPPLPTTYNNTAHGADTAFLQQLLAKEAPTAPASEPITTTTTTTTATPVNPPETPNQAEPAEANGVVVTPDPRVEIDKIERVSIEEQLAILKAAIENMKPDGKANRSKASSKVFNGQTGGQAYRKTQAVLDAAGI